MAGLTWDNIEYIDPVMSYNGPTGLTPQVDYKVSSWKGYIPSASWLNAGVTLGLSGITSMFNAFSSRKLFDLYKSQEQEILENAAIQADRIQQKGDIALANLRAQHAVSEGTNELAVAGAGAGAISGSFLDKLMANKKYDTRAEYTSSLETLYAVDNAKREGLVSAINIAGAAQQQAYKNRGDYVTSFIRGLATAVNSLTLDVRQGYANDIAAKRMYEEKRTQSLENRMLYAIPENNTQKNITGNISGDNTTYSEVDTSILNPWAELGSPFSLIPLSRGFGGNRQGVI